MISDPEAEQIGKWQKRASNRQKNAKQKVQQWCNGSLYDITFIIILRAYWASNDDRANVRWPTTCASAPEYHTMFGTEQTNLN